MTREDRQEALSLAYILAVAGVCGFTHSVRSKDYGIDLSLHDVIRDAGRWGEGGEQLDLQVKSTTVVARSGSHVGYDLDVRAYDRLRAESPVNRILALFVMPADDRQWLRVSPTRLELRTAVYWVSLRGRPAVANRRSVRVWVPTRQLFTPVAAGWIMGEIRAGRRLS